MARDMFVIMYIFSFIGHGRYGFSTYAPPDTADSTASPRWHKAGHYHTPVLMRQPLPLLLKAALMLSRRAAGARADDFTSYADMSPYALDKANFCAAFHFHADDYFALLKILI